MENYADHHQTVPKGAVSAGCSLFSHDGCINMKGKYGKNPGVMACSLISVYMNLYHFQGR